GQLQPGDRWSRLTGTGPGGQVGAVEAGRADSHQHLIWLGDRKLDVLYRDRAVRAEYRRAHHPTSRWTADYSRSDSYQVAARLGKGAWSPPRHEPFLDETLGAREPVSSADALLLDVYFRCLGPKGRPPFRRRLRAESADQCLRPRSG